MNDRFAPSEDQSGILPDSQEQSLTCIPERYTVASTPEHGSEIDRLMISDFLTTLAEIAMSVASRNLREENKGDD